jgi:hypothetical protein
MQQGIGAMLARVILLLFASLILPRLASADGPNRVGLVIQFGDGRIESQCIAFEGDQIRGDELLTQSRLRVVVDPSSGMGITVCQIEEVGCAFPAEHCFCQCMGGGPCAYWNYFYRDPGAESWTYSALGAAIRQAEPGSVEAWVWGDGHVPPPDGLAFEAICAPPTPDPTETSGPATTTPSATTPADESVPTPTTSSKPTPIPPVPTNPPPMPSSTAEFTASTTPDLSQYWLLGFVALALITMGAVVWLRRG